MRGGLRTLSNQQFGRSGPKLLRRPTAVQGLVAEGNQGCGVEAAGQKFVVITLNRLGAFAFGQNRTIALSHSIVLSFRYENRECFGVSS